MELILLRAIVSVYKVNMYEIGRGLCSPLKEMGSLQNRLSHVLSVAKTAICSLILELIDLEGSYANDKSVASQQKKAQS